MPGILLIDDSPTSLNLHTRMLRDLGLEPLVARDGVTGVGMYLEHRPAAVLADIRLPGMDGFAVLKRIRARDPDARVILTTAEPDAARTARAFELGAAAVLTKPLCDGDLPRVLEHIGVAAYLPDGSI